MGKESPEIGLRIGRTRVKVKPGKNGEKHRGINEETFDQLSERIKYLQEIIRTTEEKYSKFEKILKKRKGLKG